MDGCVYRTKDGECDLYSEGGKFHAWCDFENCNEKHPSNADRIRAMSDEELAILFAWGVDGSGKTREQWLEWLKEEVSE